MLQRGRYYIGDPTHVLDIDAWNSLSGRVGPGGELTLDDNTQIAVYPTQCNWSAVSGSDSAILEISTGSRFIGCIPVAAVRYEIRLNFGYVVEYPTQFQTTWLHNQTKVLFGDVLVTVAQNTVKKPSLLEWWMGLLKSFGSFGVMYGLGATAN